MIRHVDTKVKRGNIPREYIQKIDLYEQLLITPNSVFLFMNINSKPRALIVFDMDGVLIDVSESYRETVRETARLFFRDAISRKNLPDPLFSLTDLARLKQSGGLNNDWDLTFWVINLLFTQIKVPTKYPDADPWQTYNKTIKRCDVTKLAQFLTTEKNPITSLFKQHGRTAHDFITHLYNGDVGSGNVIKQIFQEIYLGKELFESYYRMPAKRFHKTGYINRERLLADTSVLENLSKNNTLAIATGRPKIEADYPLDVFRLRKYFSMILTFDDCLAEEEKIFKTKKINVSLSKPNPYMLDYIAKASKENISKFYYIGDMPDDMTAASRSRTGFISVGILVTSPDKDRLKTDLLRAGADHIIEDFIGLKKIIDF